MNVHVKKKKSSSILQEHNRNYHLRIKQLGKAKRKWVQRPFFGRRFRDYFLRDLHCAELLSHNDWYRNKITCTEEEIRIKTIKYNLVKENQTRIDLYDGGKIDSYPQHQ